jgi:NAD(P)H-dependent flavin oxidoreductase YrpB (nitropropane dioxygenase family)
MLSTRFTALVGCAVPIQQAGMGGVAGPRLAAAVAAAGALGMVGSARIPAPVLTGLLERLRQDAAGPVGVNVLMPFLDPACVEAAASRVRLVEFFYADPDPALIRMVHAGGALAAWQVGTEEEARAAADAGVDLIVAQGLEAGGHVRGTIGLLPLLDRVLGAVGVPVVAAGGIATARGMAAALAAGADAVRVGTRFVVADEADAHPRYQDALIAAGSGDTVLTEAFSVMWPHAPHRVLRSAVEAARAHPGEQVGEMLLGGERLPLPRFAVPTPTLRTTGAIEAMALYAGQSVGAVQARQPAAEIVRELADGAARLLGRWPPVAGRPTAAGAGSPSRRSGPAGGRARGRPADATPPGAPRRRFPRTG